jgi:hypothetical protein
MIRAGDLVKSLWDGVVDDDPIVGEVLSQDRTDCWVGSPWQPCGTASVEVGEPYTDRVPVRWRGETAVEWWLVDYLVRVDENGRELTDEDDE